MSTARIRPTVQRPRITSLTLQAMAYLAATLGLFVGTSLAAEQPGLVAE